MDTPNLFDDRAPIQKINAVDLMEMWNAAAAHFGMRMAQSIGDVGSPRYRRITNLLKRHPSRAYWAGVIDRITQSGFCKGAIPGRDGREWRADFDFLTRLETHIKVLEGKYDDDQFQRLGKHGRARVYDDNAHTLPMRRHTGDH